MMHYIATFYSHFGAIHFKRYCGTRGWQAKLMPVPRQLSSSCGTCVSFQLPQTASSGGVDVSGALNGNEKAEENAAVTENPGAWLPLSDFPEMEQLAAPEGEGYRQLWHADQTDA